MLIDAISQINKLNLSASPYYVYDLQHGIWIPKNNNYHSSNQVLNGYVAPRPSIRLRANRRQGNHGWTRSGHSQTFEALRGAIAFG